MANQLEGGTTSEPQGLQPTHWVTRRLAFWRQAFKGWGRWVTIMAGALAVFLSIRDGVIPPASRDKWYLLKFIPELPWYWWTVIGCVLLLFLAMESAFRAHERAIARIAEEHRNDLGRLRSEYQLSETLSTVRSLAASSAVDMSTVLQQLEEHYQITKLEPNIVVPPGGRVVDAHEGEHGVIIESRVEGARNLKAVIVSFYNSPSVPSRSQPRRIGKIDKVSATISYKYFDGGTGMLVHRGAWLSEPNNRMDFGTNEKHYLIIGVLDDTNRLSAVDRRFDGAHPNGITIFTPLERDLVGIHVRLISEADGKLVLDYDAILEVTRVPELKIDLLFTILWVLPRLKQLQIDGLELGVEIGELKNNNESADETKATIVQAIRDWEARAAAFIGNHLSEEQRAVFINSHPSVEQGLNKERRIRRLLSPPGKQKEPVPPFWTLLDSVKARADRLGEFEKQLLGKFGH